MARHPIAWIAALVLILLGSAGGVYGWDASRDDLLARGVTVAGVDVGGERAGEARRLLSARLSAPLRRPVVVRYGSRRFRLSARRAGVRIDIEGMVQEALARSRNGNPVSRTLDALTGSESSIRISPRVSYSRSSVRAFVRRMREQIDRRARDARLEFSGRGPRTIRGRNGRELDARPLTRAISRELRSPSADGVVVARAKVTRPDVTVNDLADRYPVLLTVDRPSFRLRFFKNLKLAKTYRVAIGRIGYETPEGLYHIQNKAVNPAWNVPDRPWAGELAGRVIPPGPENPLKARWLGIYDGAGIHGTDQEQSIGTRASRGCIRMRIPEVKELYRRVPVETPVYID